MLYRSDLGANIKEIMVLLLLGSNLGNRQLVLREARINISKNIGEIVHKSSVYETAPWGFNVSDLFLNQVIEVKTRLQPNMLLARLLEIETSMGRLRNRKTYQSRIIDLDILFYNDLVISEPDLVLPHPRLHLRKFTLIPLNEIASEYIHPVFGKTINTLLSECKDSLVVNKI